VLNPKTVSRNVRRLIETHFGASNSMAEAITDETANNMEKHNGNK